jgi:hypothetical protein
MVAGDVGVGAVLDFAGRVGKPVPDRFAFAVFIPRAFDLIGGGGCAPVETFGESNCLRGGVQSARQKRRNGGCGQGPDKLATRSQGCRQSRSFTPLNSRGAGCPNISLIMPDELAVFLAGSELYNVS